MTNNLEMLPDMNFEVVQGVANDNFKNNGGQHLWCLFGVGLNNAKVVNFVAGCPYTFVFISTYCTCTYWTTSKLVPDNFSVKLELALLSGTVAWFNVF